jgi:hypothetical protein
MKSGVENLTALDFSARFRGAPVLGNHWQPADRSGF